MAAKLKCPSCKSVLKEEGDEAKEGQGEYRVYDSRWNGKHDAGEFRIIECLNCNHFGSVWAFSE
jgi:ribosomal protein S27E